MKYLNEFHSPNLAKGNLDEIHAHVKMSSNIMKVYGGKHTALLKMAF
jgi:hypothetical protein